MSSSDRELPTCSGSYLLWLYLSKRTRIAVGKLGERIFPRGWYGYCGSACGPGGLRARLGHHLQVADRPHWHIDYLRAHARPKYICWSPELQAEHSWASQLAAHPEARRPVPGFGASDCRCVSHLLFLPRKNLLCSLSSSLEGAKPISLG